jgi:hypothetical protein
MLVSPCTLIPRQESSSSSWTFPCSKNFPNAASVKQVRRSKAIHLLPLLPLCLAAPDSRRATDLPHKYPR